MNFKGLMGIAKLGVIFSALAIVILLGMSSISVKAPSANMIAGNAVYINDSNAFIQVQPHTIRDSQWVYINATAKQFTGNVDFAVLTDTEIIDFSKIELYNPITTINNNSYTCNGDYFNYTVSPKYAWCWYNRTENIGTNSTPVFSSTINGLLFGRAFETGNIATKTIYWSESNIKNYNAFPSAITSQAIDWNGLNKAYIAANLPMNAGQNYQVRIWADVKPNSNGKYWVAFKPSAETISQAIANNHLYYIDPWWNTSYAYTQTFQVNQTINTLGGDDSAGNPKWTYILNTSQIKYSDAAGAKWGIDTASLITAGKLDSGCNGLRLVNGTNSTIEGYEVGICNSAATPIYFAPSYKTTNLNSSGSNGQVLRLFYGDTENQTTTPYGSAWANAPVDSSGYVKKVLVAYTFDKNGSTVLNDSTINRYNATYSNYTNAHVNSSGLFGNAFFFAGVGQANNFTVPNSAWNDIQNNLTLSFWFKEDGVTEGTHNQIVFKGNNGAAGDLQVLITGVQTSCGIFTSSYVEPAIAMRPTFNQWHYYVCTYDGANIKEYIDGLLAASGAQTGIVRKSADQAFTVGEDHSGGSRKMRGLIDEFILRNYSLSAEEINATYVSTINYLVGAEEGQTPASTPTFSTTEFTESFDYDSTTGIGFKLNYTNITSGAGIRVDTNILNLSGNRVLNLEASTTSSNVFTQAQSLNTTQGRFIDGVMEFNITMFTSTNDPDGTGVFFKEMQNRTSYWVGLDKYSTNGHFFTVRLCQHNADKYRYDANCGTVLKTFSTPTDSSFTDNKAIIISNGSKMKVVYNGSLIYSTDSLIASGSTSGNVTFAITANEAAANVTFDDFSIKLQTKPIISNITNNGTSSAITNFTILSTTLNTDTSSCVLQYVSTNYSMTRITGTDLFTYTLGSKSGGTNNYNFLCNSTTATNGWTNTTVSATYSEIIASVNQPIFTSNATSFPASYNPSTNTILNVSWFGTINGTSIFQLNNTNYTSTYNGSYTNSSWSGVLGAGAYNWTAWIIDGNGNGNKTDYYTFTIGKAVPNMTVGFNMTSPLTYGNITQVYGNISAGTGDQTATLVLERNGTVLSTGAGNRTYSELPAYGIWEYNLSYRDTQNYSGHSFNKTDFIINQAVLVGNLYINQTQASQIWTYPNATNATATIGARINNEGTLYLLRNGTSIGILNGANFAMNESVLGASIYNFTAAWVGQNYTFANITYDLMINKATPNIIIYLNDSFAGANQTSLTYPNSTIVNGTVIRFLGNFNASLFRNNTIINGLNENLTLGVSFWNYTAWWAGDENYTANSTTLNLTILADTGKPFFSNDNVNITDIDLDENSSVMLSAIVSEPDLNATVFQLSYPNGTSNNFTAFKSGNYWNVTLKFNFTHASQIGEVSFKIYANDSSGNENSTSLVKKLQTSKINTTIILYSSNFTSALSKFIIGSQREYIDNYFNVSIITNASGTANITKRMNITLLGVLLPNQYSNFTLSNGTASSTGYNLINNHINFTLPFTQSQSRINDLSVFVARAFNFSTYYDHGYDLYYFNASNISNTSTWLYVSFPLNNSYNPSTTNAQIELCNSPIAWNMSYPICNATWSSSLVVSQSNKGNNAIGSRIFNFEYESSLVNKNMTFNASFSEFLIRVSFVSGSQQSGGGGGGGGGFPAQPQLETITQAPLVDISQSPIATLYVYGIALSVAAWLYLSYQGKRKKKQSGGLEDIKF